MMCEEYEIYIDDLVENELDEQSAQKINLHIFACRSCSSVYETLQREKALYAHYLFDAEPSSKLTADFIRNLSFERDKIALSNTRTAKESNWKAEIFGYFRFNQAVVAAGLIFILAASFGLWIFTANERNEITEIAGHFNQHIPLDSFEKKNGNIRDENINSLKSDKSGTISASAYKIKSSEKSFKNDKNAATLNGKILRNKNEKFTKKKKSNDKTNDSTASTNLNEEEMMRNLLAKTLEIETFKQIEKIEMLLRAFRNAKSIEGSEIYDIAYEKEQAKKLLEKNVQLRRGAENFGTLYTEEILSKVEPYLLDISNLENKTSPEKISDIKARFKNQNIIASLQVYK